MKAKKRKTTMATLCIFSIIVSMLSGCGSSAQNTQPVSNVEGNIEEIAVNLVTDLSKGNYEAALSGYAYDKTMLKVINAKFLEEKLWNVLISQYGAFEEIIGHSASNSKGYDIISVKSTFQKQKLNINVVFDSNKLIAGLNYTPDTESSGDTVQKDTAQIPDGVKETSVEFGKVGWELPGTLTAPAKGGKYPVVILVHGSGPNDRDETIGPNKPFRDISWGLAEKGIASLRYDKRTFVYGEKMSTDTEAMTVYDETVEDAVLAVQFLKGRDGIDSEKIFVLGHSLGGMLIPRIAQETPGAAGYLLVSAPVTPLEDIMIEQLEYIIGLDGSNTDAATKETLENTLVQYKKMRENVKSLTPESNLTVNELFGAPASYWLDLKDYDPSKSALDIEKPMIVIQGERDYQVTMKEFEVWKKALAGKSNATVKSYPGLNHLLIKGEVRSEPSEYETAGKVDSGLIQYLADWISSGSVK